MHEAQNDDLPTLMRGECLAMLEQIAVLNGSINAKTAKIKELAAAPPISKRLQKMRGSARWWRLNWLGREAIQIAYSRRS